MKAEIDAVLRGAVDRGEVPGIAFTAGNAAGTLYEGAFGRRGLDQPAAMTPDTVVYPGANQQRRRRVPRSGRTALQTQTASTAPVSRP